MSLTHGSLFSGIGGLDLALGTPAWTCERDPYARRVLAARFPGAPCFDDVTTLSHPPAVDVLTGGFPCQDLSVAGKQAGVEGARSGLWRHMLRLTDELRPRVVVAENVANLGRQIGVIVRGFEAIGYRMEATRIAASDVGAPHERMRLLVLAYREDVPMPWPVDEFGGSWSRLRGDALVPRWVDRPLPPDAWSTLTVRDGNGSGPKKLDGRRGALVMQQVRDWPTLTARDWKSSSRGHQGNARPLSESVPGPLNPAWCEAFMGFPIGWTDPESDITPAGWPMGQGPDQHDWEPPRMVAPRTVPNRGERIRCLGNAVVPAIGAVAAARVRQCL